MKTKKIIFCAVSLFLAAVAAADYNSPPAWNNFADFTHQSWDFASDQSEALPAPPDGLPEWINQFGTPGLTNITYSTYMAYWVHQYSEIPTTRTGYYGGMADTALTFHVPLNNRSANWRTEVWVQTTYFARNDLPDNYLLEISRNDSFTDTNDIIEKSLLFEQLPEPPGTSGLGLWYRVTAIYEFQIPPADTYIRFTAYQYPPDANHPVGGATMIDQTDIDTRSVNIADINTDGIVNIGDMAVIARNWLE